MSEHAHKMHQHQEKRGKLMFEHAHKMHQHQEKKKKRETHV